jgi:hypothetical protein
MHHLFFTEILSQIADDFAYTVQVERPLGVVVGENTAPYHGLMVDEVGTAKRRVLLWVINCWP